MQNTNLSRHSGRTAFCANEINFQAIIRWQPFPLLDLGVANDLIWFLGRWTPQTGASLEELSSMTKRNAENSHQAHDLATQTRVAADKGAADMREMSTAMEAIKVSSADIAKLPRQLMKLPFRPIFWP